MLAIEIEGLTHYYGRTPAVREVSISIPEGSCYGFLGANGAGKTTTIRSLLGLIRPRRGRVRIFGRRLSPASRTEILSDIGYLPGELTLYPDMAGLDLLDLYASFYPRGSSGRERVLAALELSAADLRRPFREYSLGMKQKLGLAQALQHEPRLVILDEPTTGLDPLIQHNIHALLREVREGGTTIFMSSHNLKEVEDCCGYAAIIYRGQIVAGGRLEELKGQRAGLLEVELGPEAPVEGIEVRGARVIRSRGNRVLLGLEDDVPAILGELSRLPVRNVHCMEPGLDEIFMTYYRGGQSPEGGGSWPPEDA